jgi:hypothetical protein
LPCSSLTQINEAARVPDDLYRAVCPMLATSGSRLICLSTPYGKRGFFSDCRSRGGDDWLRFEVPATQIPRIKPDFLQIRAPRLGLILVSPGLLLFLQGARGPGLPRLRPLCRPLRTTSPHPCCAARVTIGSRAGLTKTSGLHCPSPHPSSLPPRGPSTNYKPGSCSPAPLCAPCSFCAFAILKCTVSPFSLLARIIHEMGKAATGVPPVG